ncbi:MAG: glycosyltransferase family 4 protein [Planctomycetaceae bacterium]|nr:glycosyltransferase family 4 protein [Planctomycetaceae bacterium]
MVHAPASTVAQAGVLSDLAAISASRGHFRAAQCGWHQALRLDPEQAAARRNLAVLSSLLSECPSDDGVPQPRIAILSLLFNWPSTGGGTIHTKELADVLQADGYDVRHVYAVYEPWGVGHVAEQRAVPTVPLLFHEREWTADNIQDRFREAVDAFAPHAVIITDSWNTKPLLAEAVADYPYFLRLAALETICPLNNVRLLFENGCIIQCLRNQLAEPEFCRSCVQHLAGHSGGLHQAERELAGFDAEDYPERLRRAYRGAAAVLAVNPEIAELVRPFCRRVEVIPSGFDPTRFSELPEPEEVQESPSTQFLFAGLVDEPMKGFPVLFMACRQLWSERKDFELVVTSEWRSEWDAPFIRWIGWQSQAELPRAIARADVLVFPTVAQEALGRSAVEAMGCGKPVIASRLGGLTWVVEEERTGLMVTPGDPADLASKMARLMDQPALRRQWGRAGREKFSREFTWPVILERCYRPLLPQTVATYGASR